MKLHLGKGGELSLRANTVTQHPKYKHRGRQKSRHLPGALGWLAKIPRVPHAESAAGAKKIKIKNRAPLSRPPPKIPVPPSSLLPPAGQTERTRVPDCLDSQPRKNNFQSIQHPRPPVQAKPPQNTLSLLGKITALKGNCRHATSSGFMTKKKRENKATSRGVGLHSPMPTPGSAARQGTGEGPGPVDSRQRGHREN